MKEKIMLYAAVVILLASWLILAAGVMKFGY